MLTWKAPLTPAFPSGGAVAATLRGPSCASRKRNNTTPDTCKGQMAGTAKIDGASCTQWRGHRLRTMNYGNLQQRRQNQFPFLEPRRIVKQQSGKKRKLAPLGKGQSSSGHNLIRFNGHLALRVLQPSPTNTETWQRLPRHQGAVLPVIILT